MKSKLISVIVILGVLFGSFASVQAIHRVQAAGLECKVDDTAIGTNSGSSWTDAYTDLQSALSDSGCTQIQVAAGT